MKKLNLGILLAIVLISISGCSSSEDDRMREFIKCSIVANEMGDYQSAAKVHKKMKSFIKKNSEYFDKINNPNAYIMKLTEDTRNNDLELYKYNTMGKRKVIYDNYHSDECQELYK
jgi:hypothetical protein